LFGVGPNVHIQHYEHTHIGKKVWIGQGSCLITQNHVPGQPKKHGEIWDITIGDECWLGANVVILPGVVLGPRTTVGAGAVVVDSYPKGNVILIGIPAKPTKIDVENTPLQDIVFEEC
jgi:acetyltransferase-like isoleucine patch superfamily enzyme